MEVQGESLCDLEEVRGVSIQQFDCRDHCTLQGGCFLSEQELSRGNSRMSGIGNQKVKGYSAWRFQINGSKSGIWKCGES